MMRRIIPLCMLCLIALTSWAETTKTSNTIANAKPSPEVLKLAKTAYDCAVTTGAAKPQTLTIIDYSLPSTQKRMWVLDMENNKTLFHTLVAHGKGSGEVMASRFSNTPNSRATSLGLFKTAGTYHGSNGFSLRLIGLDKGYNDKAESRAVVMHGANYVSESHVKAGRLGRSWGCPAVPRALAKSIINEIKGGDLIFAYYPDKKWLKNSKYLNCAKNLTAAYSRSLTKKARAV